MPWGLWGKGDAGYSALSPDPPLHLFHQVQEGLLELGRHRVSLVESGNGAALAQARRGSLCSVAGEEVCYHLHGSGDWKPVTDRQGSLDKPPGLKGSEKQLDSRYPGLPMGSTPPRGPVPQQGCFPLCSGECTALAVNLVLVRERMAHRGEEAAIFLS